MSERPWYKRYGADFISGTLGLSLEEKGAYSIVLDLIYDRGHGIPDDARYIAGACGCSVRKWNSIRQRLIDLGKITAENGIISNFRAEKEIENSAKTARKFAENGRKGGEKSAEKRPGANENNDLGKAPLEHRAHKPEARSQKEEKTEPNGSAKKGSRIPNAWGPGVGGRQFAIDAGLSSEQIDHEAAKFRDYWSAKTGASATKVDWLATWRNWVRTAAERHAVKPAGEKSFMDQIRPAAIYDGLL